MVVIRLARAGSKKRPFYYVVAADKRAKRDGRHLEKLGYWNPIASGQEKKLELKLDNLLAWVKTGAQCSPRVKSLVKQFEKETSVQETEAA